MDLKNLILRELSEGLTEKQLASAVRVPLRTLVNALAGKNPKDHAVWERFARYFRMEPDVLHPLNRKCEGATKERTMRRQILGLFVVLAVWCLSGIPIGDAAARSEQAHSHLIP